MEELEVKLSELLDETAIDLEMDVQSKHEAIERLTDLLVFNGVIESKATFLEDVYEREAQGLTGIGNGIAIPHGKSAGVQKTSIAIGRSKNGLEWETLDEEPVQTIILFAVKESDKNNFHLKLLAKIAGALADEEVCHQVKNAGSVEEIIRALQEEK
ncbi:PTS sugar transporter subunit IIA [Oceanobacillus sp. CFH 90083]|uniref:PTS sugar transporter subunit IIA n=1 Tax=Oceanobacillus sp. CFH 90083 TaxID=2592336 RepID=UPI001D142427|nr:PTS sugar transporter subunit IIA [Oceanobacillus sp. CFH 90083]